jgi:hypothetical protein
MLDHTAAKPPSPLPDVVPVGFAVRSALDWLILTAQTALDWLVLTAETTLDLTASKPPSPPPVMMRCQPDSSLDLLDYRRSLNYGDASLDQRAKEGLRVEVTQRHALRLW